MKKTLIAVFCLIALGFSMSSCKSLNPLSPVAVPTACATQPAVYSVLYGSTIGPNLNITGNKVVIRTQAEYASAYTAWAAAGSPTPTPIPVDFSKQIVIGVKFIEGCQMTAYNITGMNKDCGSLFLDEQVTPYCDYGGPHCGVVMTLQTAYVVDAAGLAVMEQDSTVNCDGTTTTASAVPF